MAVDKAISATVAAEAAATVYMTLVAGISTVAAAEVDKAVITYIYAAAITEDGKQAAAKLSARAAAVITAEVNETVFTKHVA